VAREQARRAEAEAARAEREAAKSDRVAEFMASLLGAADPMARETTEAPTVGQVVARAAERVERDLGDSPEVQAAVLAELSALAFNGEDVATGKAYAERAQALLDALPAPDPVVSASVARVAGEALLRAADPSAAATVFRDGLARIAGELDQPQPRRTARIAAAQLENGLGVALYMLTQGVDSAAAFERSIALQAQLYGDESPQVGVQAANLATVQWSAGQPKDAALSSARAVAIHRKHLGPDDPRLAIVLNMQASIYDDLGRGDEAMAIAREALAIAEKAHGPESPRITDMLQNLGELHLMHGEFDAAQVPLARAIAIARRSADPRERFLAARSLGQLAMYRDRPGEAIPWLEEAREAAIKRTSGQGGVPLMARAMLAWARGLAGAHDAALAELEEVRIALAALPQPDPTDELVRRYYTGEVALAAGRLPLAIENLREALRLADANPPYATSTFAHQSRIALGIALWPDPARRDEARSLVEAGIAGLEGKSMGFHPLVARGRAVLGAPP
jgi:serine/threonine-protein kinase